MASILTKVAKAVTTIAVAVAGACLLLMMLQMVADITLKAVFNEPIEGNLEVVSYYYMVAVVFLPLGLVELEHEHIHVDMFVRPLPPAARNIVYVGANLVAIVFVGLLAYQTFLDALRATEIDEVVMGTILVPIWPAKWALPVGFVSLILALLANIARALADLKGFEPRQQAPVAD